jgi:phospholipid/cholesterol/gamma-HCH transport system substrate-binding protein
LEFVRADPQLLMVIFPNQEDQQLIPEPFTDGEYIRYGRKAKDPFNLLFEVQTDVQETLQSIRRAGDSIEQAGSGFALMVQDVQKAVGGTDQKLAQVGDQAVEALEEFQGAMREVRNLVGNPELNQNLESAVEMLPQVLDEAQTAFDSFEQAGSQIQKVGVEAESVVKKADEAIAGIRDAAKSADRSFSSAEQMINNLEQFSEPLAERGDELVEQAMQTLKRMDSALVEVRTFGATLNNSDGTVKRLLEDDEIYWQVRRTIANIEEATAKIRPILDDVRIFSDKIARDPRQIGVRGALTKRPSGMGLK